MKVLHVVSSGGLYGAEAVILSLCEEFARMGHESAIATFDNKHLPNHQLAEAAQSRGIRVHSVPCRNQFDGAAVRRLGALIETGEYDVCHSHGFKSDVYLYLAARKSHRAMVATCHGWIDSDHQVKLYGVLDRWILRRFDHVVSVASDVTHRLTSAGVRTQRITFIRNGVDLTRFRSKKRTLRDELGLGSEYVLVGTVGRLSPEKGIEHLLRAVRGLRVNHPNLRYAIVGDGPERESLTGLSNEFGVSDIVRFLGRRSDTPEVFASLDILAQPSLSEGLPITLLEALASGCAVVATSVGAVPEVIENRVCGILVPAADSELLAQAVSQLANDTGLRRRISSAAIKRSEDFSARRMAQAYLDVYQKALQRESRGASATL